MPNKTAVKRQLLNNSESDVPTRFNMAADAI